MPRNMSEKANYANFSDVATRGRLSPLDIQRSARGYPTIVNTQPCPKRCLLMPLTSPRVGARTDSTTRYSNNARRGQFPRTRIGIVLCAEGFALQCFSFNLCILHDLLASNYLSSLLCALVCLTINNNKFKHS